MVVPNIRLGRMAESAGLIAEDEMWLAQDLIAHVRGRYLTGWRYLDTVDPPPPIGSRPAVVEAWLTREETVFPPLTPLVAMALDAIVTFSGP